MCGITGLLDPERRFAPAALAEVAGRMADTLRHRGPDSSGVWAEPAGGVALGHRRLAIIDLSRAGHQPMVSARGRYCLVFGGEIYNHPALRRRLLSTGAQLRGHSDTEVLLAAIETWGLEAALEAVVGMFAFALWDRRSRVLSLARDHLGQKPLFFGRSGSTFAFASELKAFAAHPDLPGGGKPGRARAVPAAPVRACAAHDLAQRGEAAGGLPAVGASRRREPRRGGPAGPDRVLLVPANGRRGRARRGQSPDRG